MGIVFRGTEKEEFVGEKSCKQNVNYEKTADFFKEST
jgi:hypothetical protein